jgi:anti-anti-sigma factor
MVDTYLKDTDREYREEQDLEREREPVPASYQLIRETIGDVEILRALGELDLATAPELEANLRSIGSRNGVRAIVMDLTDCRYLDSTTLAVFVRVTRDFDERLSLVVPPDNRITRIFAIVELDRLLQIDASMSAAAERIGFTFK